ncbi:TPA: hypothetical protein ACH3X3_007820 [Trebouxia sp. C0006]
MPYSTEMHTSVDICNFVGSVWESLTTHSPIKLKHSLLFNKTLQLHNVSSHAIAPKSRPDTMLVAENCTLLLGEDKHSDLAAAYQDLNRKRVDLSGLHYGPLKCMLGYVAAETTVQWCFIPSHADQPVQVVGPRLDFFSIQDRVSLLLSLVQAYRLLAVMSKSVPPLPGRIPLYQEIATENSIIVMEGTTVFKQINKFEDYQRRQNTSLAAIQKAYGAADEAAIAANLAGALQYLVSPVSQPSVGRKKEYQVRTQPCGYNTSVSTEQELHALAVACCSAAKVLHDYKLVHRDLRLPNVVQLGREHYLVIDLESVASTAAKALPQDFHNVLKTCNAEALDDARHFTVMSDMFCIGVLLKEVVDSRATPYSAQANRFIRKLLDKDLAAVPALMWLQREWCP